MCIQLLLVSGLLSAFGFPFLLPREFSIFTGFGNQGGAPI